MIRLNDLFDVVKIAVAAVLIAAGFNLFLIPHQLLSGGLSGISMMIGYFTGWNIALLYFLINLPVLVWGWIDIGRRFIALSIVSVLLTSWFIQIIPENSVNSDPIIGAVFGGVLIGLGSGISLRSGGSSGGFDIIGSILTHRYDFPLGMLLFGLNGAVVLALGLVLGWDAALRSMLAIFIAGKVVDTLHVRHIKVTAFIVTKERQQMTERLLVLPRGVTLIRTEGAYSHTPHDMLMTVTTRYELAELRKIVKETDPKAFVNIVETVEVIGQFRKLR
ncbi:YitT family protein [Paenibacillus ginsengarvi]|uniref:YitT family protein n=1 Tax=Paenibacillus ginsengarvi TaxID=400777 RepID=A0A3B0CJY8_9BACL|nr:YitT family protein [Paenibacillus ginsengarvi]RKN85008.1 YitT family protein [Paenibacillus ginsengarvi]